MDKITYLAQLAEGLARWVPERERQDILRYYAEYFEEAGPGREAEVVAELGDPWALSSRLAVEGGYVSWEQANAWVPTRKKRKWPWVLAVCAVLSAALIGILSWAAVRWSAYGLRGGAAWQGAEVLAPGIDSVEEGPVTYYYYDEGGCTGAFSSIDADIGLGNIQVAPGSDYTVYIDQSARLNGYRVSWEVRDGTLKLRDGGGAGHVEIGSWDDLKSLFGVDLDGVDVFITVPDGVPLDRISVKTGLGNVELHGVFAGKVSAETGMGNVECEELRYAQKVELESGMGDVTLYLEEPWSGVELELETGMGSVEVQMGCAEWDCAYKLETGMGNVTVDGEGRGNRTERRGDAPYQLDAESGMGDIHVDFYGD